MMPQLQPTIRQVLELYPKCAKCGRAIEDAAFAEIIPRGTASRCVHKKCPPEKAA